MKAVPTFLLTICFWSCLLTGQCQVNQTTHSQPVPLPVLQDWFLSTGNWQNDPQLYVREFGNGSQTIVMLHGGWGGEHSGLLEAVRNLANQYHFVFYDQRGSLRSPFPDSLITFAHHIEDLERLRKALKLEKLSLVGHSMGAVLASAYASTYPQHVKQLILLAPAYLKYPIPEEDQALYQQENALLEAFLNRPAVTQELDRYGLTRQTPPLSSQEETSKFRIELGKRMLYDIRKWPYLTGGRALYKAHVFELTANTYPKSGWNYIAEFKRQSYPVSIIIGDHDFLDFGNGLVKKWVSGVPQIKLSVIKNAGHDLWIDQPEVCITELQRHLERAK